MNHLFYKTCVVPYCISTSIKTPEKLFIYVPNNKTTRKKWLTLARRSDAHSLSAKTSLYFCEDHFDLPNEMLNYTEYRIMGKVSQVRMKPGCTPSRFACQEDRRKRTTHKERSYIKKKQQMRIIEECLNEAERSLPSSSQKVSLHTSSVYTSPLNMHGTEETKYNIMKRDSEYCYACLTADRKLTRIGDVDDYTELIINITNNSIKYPQEMELCWECLAELRRMKQFKLRIEMAQNILQCEQEEKKNVSLSRLSVIHTDHIIFMIHEDEEKPILDVKIKEEIEFDDGFNANLDQEETEIPHFDSTTEQKYFEYKLKVENDETQQIKKEKVISKTKETKNKNTKVDYRFLYGLNNFKRSTLRKKFDIPPEDVLSWIEKEKKGSFFKSLNFKCKLCYQGFNYSKERLKEHYAQYHDESLGPHTCSTCSYRFGSQAQMLAHTQKHAQAFECTHCGYQCYTLKGMNAHIDSHRMVQCAYCEMVLPTVGAFRVHQKSYHKEFVCDHCNKIFRSKNMIEKHIIRYHLNPHKCSDCDRVYLSRPALLKHRFTKHTTCEPELAYCVLCDKQFKNVYLYRRHVQTSNAHVSELQETTNKKFKCPECSNSYARRQAMMNHWRFVHKKDSKYKCQQCNRQFLTSTRLQGHVRIKHEGVRPEKNKLCSVCGRGFSDNRILQNHIRTHSGERPFECEYCDAKFTQKQAMLSHVKYIHLKNKRKACWQHYQKLNKCKKHI